MNGTLVASVWFYSDLGNGLGVIDLCWSKSNFPMICCPMSQDPVVFNVPGSCFDVEYVCLLLLFFQKIIQLVIFALSGLS